MVGHIAVVVVQQLVPAASGLILLGRDACGQLLEIAVECLVVVGSSKASD